MSSEDVNKAYNAGLMGGMPTGNSPAEMAAYNAGLASFRGRSGGGGGAGGGLGLVALPFVAPPVFVIGTCLYPLPGLLTLAGGAMLAGLADEWRLNALMAFFLLVVPCFLIFVLGMMLEKRLEAFSLYRQLRHVARLAIVGFVTHVIVFAFRGAGSFRHDTPFLERISFLHVLIVLCVMTAAHFGFRRLDQKLGAADNYLARLRWRRAS